MITSLTVDTTANNIRMIVNSDNDPIDSSRLIAEVSGNALITQRLDVDDISIDNDIITTTVSNSNLEFRALGTGELVIDDMSIVGNTIKNNTPSAGVLSISSSGFGRVKINNTYGIVVPFGTNAQRPTEDPPVGDTRWNTESVVLETWDGDTYITAAGIAAAISADEFNDILLEYTLALG
jgi:hypothetical protein